MSGFNVLLPTLIKAMDIPDSVSVWPASSFSLVVGATLLVFGRVADMTGGYPLYIGGLSWLIIWSIITGFSQNTNMLIVCRAIQGFGPAMYLPSGVMLLSNTYRPGKRKNIVFSIYATCGALGFFYGILMSGVAAQYINWRWYFWLGAISGGITLAAAVLCVPSDVHESRERGVKMDWLGSLFIVLGLALVVFGFTESPHAPHGWKTPYVSVLFVIGWLSLGVAFYIEGWVAEHPLLPFDVFHVKYMKSFTIALWFFFGCSGVFLFYGVNFMQEEMGASPMTVVAWFLPMLAGGIGFPCFLGLYLDKVSGTLLLLICNAAWIVLAVLFAVANPESTYWRYVFPSMICATVGIDIVWDVSHIFITTNQASERQGLCGALINSILHVGIAVLLGVADIVNDQVSRHKGQLESYRAVFWFEFGCAVVSGVLMVFFVRIKPQKSELTVDEKRMLEERRARQQEAAMSATQQQPVEGGEQGKIEKKGRT